MNKILLFFLLGPIGVVAQQMGVGAQPNSYTIKGQGSISGSHVYLLNQNEGKVQVDSALVTEGKYSFTGTVSHPGPVALLDVPVLSPEARVKRHAATLFLEAAVITVQHVDSFSNTKVSGGPSNVEYTRLLALLKPVIDKTQSLSSEYGQAYMSQDTGKIRLLQKELMANQQAMLGTLRNYASENTASPIALFALETSVREDSDPDTVESVFNRLPQTVKASEQGQALQKRLEAMGITNIGKLAPEFTQNDTLDKPVRLTSFRGHYVLLDFWASWCGPCRAENPNVVAAFNKYKKKGFLILGISLDRPGARDKWLEAIHKDGLIWTQVSDLKFWDNAVAKAYGINSIPQNYLLDPNGKIVAKGLRAEELDKKLGEIYK